MPGEGTLPGQGDAERDAREAAELDRIRAAVAQLEPLHALVVQLRELLGRRQVIDVAVGVIMAARRYDDSAAFAELMALSEQHSLSLTVLSEAVVDVIGAGGAATPPDLVAVVREYLRAPDDRPPQQSEPTG